MNTNCSQLIYKLQHKCPTVKKKTSYDAMFIELKSKKYEIIQFTSLLYKLNSEVNF